jgi:hypothetical protein
MKPYIRQLALAGLFLLSAGAASAAVKVTYDHPEKFTDVPFTNWDREEVLNQLTDHFNKLGKALPAGEDMNIEVLDVDLAGREVPGHRANEIRIVRGQADWPRMHLRYSLVQNGAVVKSGEVQLSDLNYAGHLSRYTDSDPLRYEKYMIDQWFEKDIAPMKPAKK